MTFLDPHRAWVDALDTDLKIRQPFTLATGLAGKQARHQAALFRSMQRTKNIFRVAAARECDQYVPTLPKG